MHGSEDGSARWPDPDTVSSIEGKQGTSEAGVIPTSVSRETLPDEILLTARELSGLSQRKLATELDTSQPSIVVLESGRRLPTIRTLIKVAEASGLELVVGLRRPAARHPVALGALVSNADDGLADFLPMKAPSPFEGPPDR